MWVSNSKSIIISAISIPMCWCPPPTSWKTIISIFSFFSNKSRNPSISSTSEPETINLLLETLNDYNQIDDDRSFLKQCILLNNAKYDKNIHFVKFLFYKFCLKFVLFAV